MDNKKNNTQYMQVIPHYIFFQVLLLFYHQNYMVELVVFYLMAGGEMALDLTVNYFLLFLESLLP